MTALHSCILAMWCSMPVAVPTIIVIYICIRVRLGGCSWYRWRHGFHLLLLSLLCFFFRSQPLSGWMSYPKEWKNCNTLNKTQETNKWSTVQPSWFNSSKSVLVAWFWVNNAIVLLGGESKLWPMFSYCWERNFWSFCSTSRRFFCNSARRPRRLWTLIIHCKDKTNCSLLKVQVHKQKWYVYRNLTCVHGCAIIQNSC